jgi:hypothetical protein
MNDFFLKHEMNWTFVIKAFRDYPNSFIENISDLPCLSIASDNESHLQIIKQLNPYMETWFLNYSGAKQIKDFIDVNLTHSNESRVDKTCFMLSIDSEREGIDFNTEKTYQKVGAYLDCAKPPKPDFFDAWARLKIPDNITQSLGTSISFESIDQLKSKGVNHFRIGEIILTGKSLIDGSKIKGLRQDVFENQKNVSYYLISNLYSQNARN